jgi:hypothetical protein
MARNTCSSVLYLFDIQKIFIMMYYKECIELNKTVSLAETETKSNFFIQYKYELKVD